MAKGKWWLPDKFGGTIVNESAKWLWSTYSLAAMTILQSAYYYFAANPGAMPLLIGLACVAFCLIATIVVSRAAKSRSELELVSGRKFKNEVVSMDGKNYYECRFENVKYEFNATRMFGMNKCSLAGSRIVTSRNPQVMMTILWLRGLGLMANDIPIEADSPINVEPPTTTLGGNASGM